MHSETITDWRRVLRRCAGWTAGLAIAGSLAAGLESATLSLEAEVREELPAHVLAVEYCRERGGSPLAPQGIRIAAAKPGPESLRQACAHAAREGVPFALAEGKLFFGYEPPAWNDRTQILESARSLEDFLEGLPEEVEPVLEAGELRIGLPRETSYRALGRRELASQLTDAMCARSAHGKDPRLRRTVEATLHIESSGGDPSSVSPAGAIGSWQVMPHMAMRQDGVLDLLRGLAPRERTLLETAYALKLKNPFHAIEYAEPLLSEAFTQSLRDPVLTGVIYNKGCKGGCPTYATLHKMPLETRLHARKFREFLER